MKLWPLLLLLALTACTEQDDLQGYVAEVRARPAEPPEPMPEVKSYVPEPYAPVSRRSPFVTPQPETADGGPAPSARCEQPDAEREKQPLERYSLNNLAMRGILENGAGIRALIVTGDGEAHLVAVGDRLGVNHGEVTAVSHERLLLTEYLPDGRGCWNRRETSLELAGDPQPN